MAEEEEIQADNGDAEADLDALVNESEDSVSDDDGGGLADLVTAGGDDAVGDGGDAVDLDEMLDDASSVPMEVGSEEAVAEGMGVEFLMEMPLTLTFEVGRAKLKIALAKGKRQYDKRAAIREREWNREQHRLLKSTR